MNFSENSEEYLKFRKLQFKVIERLVEKGYTTFISGMATGFDTWVAEDICRLKKDGKGISLVCAIPFPEQDANWNYRDKSRRYSLIAQADEVNVVCPHYTKDCFFVRNRYMVDNASILVCCYDGKSGGTAYTIDYAKKNKKTIIEINPTTLKVEVFGNSDIYDL